MTVSAIATNDLCITLDDIHAAAKRIAGGVYVSPCPQSVPLSNITGSQIFCKLDYLQRTGSFKERGGRNALLLLDKAAHKRGVIAASAGNHAQALAYHGNLLNIPVTVVMPTWAPIMKIANCQAMGATVILEGSDFGQSKNKAMQLVEEKGFTYINGFDDPAVIAGQGTMGLEILEQVPDVDAVIVPVGGAGLIAGVAMAMKCLRPQVQIIGVEPMKAASFTAALAAGKPVPVEITPTIADGLAVPQVGSNAFKIAQRFVDRVVTVDDHVISLAVLRLVELEKGVVEGAGASPLAACLAGLVPELKGKKVVLPLCGGNIDTTVLGRVIDRGLAADGRLCRFVAGISDRPGGLARFAAVIAQAGASIKDITHDRIFAKDDLNSADAHCVVETRDRQHILRLKDALASAGFPVRFDE